MNRLRGAGFTLIELMVTLAVVAVMMVLAAPSFLTFQRNSQLTSTANSLLAALSAGRAEAMKRQLNVFVTPTNGSDWTQGWTVFVDSNWDLSYTAGTDVLVSTQAAIPATVTVSADTTQLNGSSHYVMFTGDGYVRKNDNTLLTGASVPSVTFTNGTDSRIIIVSPSGRMRVCVPDATTCNASDAL